MSTLHSLHIKVVEGHNLLAADSNGFSDPYAVLTVDKTTNKTQVIKTTLNPKWNETFTFDAVQSSSHCNIRIKDWNRLSSDKFLGSCDVALNDYMNGRPKAKWYTLQYYDPLKGSTPAGQILLVIHLAEKGGKSLVESIPTTVSMKHLNFVAEGSGQLLIEVVEGRTLAVKDLNGLSDPYCVVKVGKQVSKTNIVEKSLDPVWNEAFSFEVGSQISYFVIEINDWDAIGKDDPMGMVQINMKDLESEGLRDEWFSVKPQTNERVSGQLRLRVQYTSPQNSQKSCIIARENYIQLALHLTNRGMILATHLLQIYESQELARAMAHLFNSEKKFMLLVKECIEIERKKVSAELLFKGESATTKLLVAYFRWVDAECGYLKTCVLPVINYIVENPLEFEVDPERTKRSTNTKKLQDTSQRMLNLIFASRIPSPIREILAAVKQQLDDLRDAHAIGGVIFLRFICAAISAPETFGLLEGVPINTEARRALTLVSKVIQNLASDFPFGERESFMTVFNPFIENNKDAYNNFISASMVYPIEGDEHESFPIKYNMNDKVDHMAIVVKNLHNNFSTLSNHLLATKEVSKDIAYAAEVKLHFDELRDIFAKYQ